MFRACKKRREDKKYRETITNTVYARGYKTPATAFDVQIARKELRGSQADKFFKHHDDLIAGKITKGQHLIEKDAADQPYCICGIVSAPLAFHYIP
jgi:hypothetical protein